MAEGLHVYLVSLILSAARNPMPISNQNAAVSQFLVLKASNTETPKKKQEHSEVCAHSYLFHSITIFCRSKMTILMDIKDDPRQRWK